MIRKIDEYGRIVIPIGFRRKFNMSVGDSVKLIECDGGIMISPIKSRCAICGRGEDLTEFCSKHICMDCIKQINSL